MKMSIFLVFLPYLASFFLEILATQIQILLFLNLIFCSFGMSVSCSSVTGIQLSLSELCPSFFLLFFPSSSRSPSSLSVQVNWRKKPFHLCNQVTRNSFESCFKVVLSQFHCLPDNFLVIDDICCCFHFVQVTQILNSCNLVFLWVHVLWMSSFNLIDPVLCVWCFQIRKGYRSYWNTNVTVQFEVLFYHLGQCFSAAVFVPWWF